MKGIVDRIEGDILVVEVEGDYLEFDKALFPSNIKEGDIVKEVKDKYIIDKSETIKRKKYMESLLESLFDED